jgi:hypothetical protein
LGTAAAHAATDFQAALANYSTISGLSGYPSTFPTSGVYLASTYNVGSTTGGLQEAANAIPSSGSGIILVTTPITMTGPFVMPASKNITIQGPGSGYDIIFRDSGFTTDHLFKVSGASIWGLTLRNIGIQSYFFTQTGSAALWASQCGNGKVVLDDVVFSNGNIGVSDQACMMIGSFQVEMDATASPQPFAGMYLQSYNPSGTEETTNIYLHDVIIGGVESSAYAPLYGIFTDGSDGVLINGLSIQGITDIGVAPSTSYVANWKISHIASDGFAQFGIHLSGTGTIINFDVDGGWMNGPTSTSSPYNTALSIGGATSSASFSNLQLGGSYKGCVQIGPSGTPRSIKLDNIACLDGNQSNDAGAVGSSGVYVYAGMSGLNLSNLRFYNTSGTGHIKTGVYVAGSLADSVINSLSSNLTADSSTDPAIFWASPSTATNVVVSGVQDTNHLLNIPLASISDAATLVWPNWNSFLITGSGTTVTAVTMTNVQAGASGVFRTTGGAITFTAGGGIGNTMTTAQNVPVVWTWDGSSLWLK